jgi:pimeloyl-ACP methyl ester carboxylesterase
MANCRDAQTVHREVTILAGGHRLGGLLDVPPDANGAVLFAHGSGSGRLSPRNQYVARVLQQAGLATLLFDLLDDKEAQDRDNVFDIELLASPLEVGADWAAGQDATRRLPLGYFGASTGAAAALIAAAKQGEGIRAVVSRGGRPDLASAALPRVKSPTLLIVGGDDEPVVELNRRAFAQLRCEKRLAIVPRATHLFSEPGALEQVAALAAEWFMRHVSGQ